MLSEQLEPQPYRVQQGYLIMTQNILDKSTRWKTEADHEERCRMFRDFSGYDQGRSRTFLAAFESPQECADFVAMHNRLIDKIDLLEYELREALEYKYMYEDLCR